MAEGTRPNVFTIPPDRAFADALAEGVLAQYGDDRMAMARGIILVPNNRAGQSIQDAFVRKADRGLLLPRIVAIGDPELEERTGPLLDPLDGEAIPPAIPTLQRQFLLARLLQREKAGLNAAEAMRLASDLGRVLDQLHVERVPATRLRELDQANLSEHWQTALAQLDLILTRWPEMLAGAGAIDLSDRRNRQLDAVARRWRESPPPGFVIAAGISTTAPAIAELLRVIARLPNGSVILAGLDTGMDTAQWDVIEEGEETHPQHHLTVLLDRMSVGRTEADIWPWAKTTSDRKTRTQAVSWALAPAQFTEEWATLEKPAKPFQDVHTLEMANPAHEAQAIALAIRHALETPERTVALVTLDRDLAGRVSALLKRWDIEADDSAGRTLAATLPGSLLLGLAETLVADFAPTSLLTLLKHPLSKAGEERQVWLDKARALDLALRGPRPASGIGGVTAFLLQGDERTRIVREVALEGWKDIAAILSPITDEFAAASSLGAMIAALRSGLSALAGDAAWARQEGRMLADLLSDIETHAPEGPERIDPVTLPLMLRQLLESATVRPAQGGHHRVFIWGLIEARLQSADLMILGGLNEGVWPSLPAPDPWLAPAIRKQLGLPGLERRIGREAHDLAGALGAREVILTRAKRDARSPTVASRFWLRLQTMTGGLGAPEPRFDLLALALDSSKEKPKRARRPAPSPPVSARPRTISVTDVGGLKADAYSFYAKKMLLLKALRAIDADPDDAWRGSLLHRALERWAEHDSWAPGALVPKIIEALEAPGIHPLNRALWEQRFVEAATWIEATVAADLVDGRTPKAAEIFGSIRLAGARLTGQADRIDQLATGGLAIVDYKTTKPPSLAKVNGGFAPQLGLIALIAELGGFSDISGEVEMFEYWSLARKQSKGNYGFRQSPHETKGKSKADPSIFVETCEKQFVDLVTEFLTGEAPFTAKQHPEYAYAEFDHLMRLEEWQGRG